MAGKAGTKRAVGAVAPRNKAAQGRATRVVRLAADLISEVLAVAAEKELPTASLAVDYLLRYALARRAALARDNEKRARAVAR